MPGSCGKDLRLSEQPHLFSLFLVDPQPMSSLAAFQHELPLPAWVWMELHSYMNRTKFKKLEAHMGISLSDSAVHVMFWPKRHNTYRQPKDLSFALLWTNQEINPQSFLMSWSIKLTNKTYFLGSLNRYGPLLGITWGCTVITLEDFNSSLSAEYRFLLKTSPNVSLLYPQIITCFSTL